MGQESKVSDRRGTPARTAVWQGGTTVLLLALAAIQLRHQGRSWWCSCGHWWPWAGDVWTLHNSQHLADPYSLTHVLHGLALCGLLAFAAARLPWVWQLVLALWLEALWEVIENTEFAIQRYRDATLALGYTGDAIANSMGDVAFCGVGFLIARYLGFWRSVMVFLLVEGLLLWWIRDNLTLNVVMLVWPVDAIKAWQMGH